MNMKASPSVSTVISVSRRRKKGSQSLSKLKHELDRVFSLWVRSGANKCYTCDKSTTLQNGHFIPRQYLATRWEPDNCRPQCVGCNIWGKGMFLEFEERLVKELGKGRVQELKDARKTLTKLNRAWYEKEIDIYTGMLKTKEGSV